MRARRAGRARLRPGGGGGRGGPPPPPRGAGGGGRGVEPAAAAEGVGGGERGDQEPVTPRRHERLLEAQLEVAAAELGEARRRLTRAVVHGDARAAVRPRVGRGPLERDVDAEARRERIAVR